MITWNTDAQLFEQMKKELFTAVVGDIMDEMGLYHQFLPARIRPLRDNMVLAGRAMTVLEADTLSPRSGAHSAVLTQPFGVMLDALDDLKENEIYLSSGASEDRKSVV